MDNSTMNILDETWCVYCYRNFETVDKFHEHIEKRHKNSYAYNLLQERRTAERIDPGIALARKKFQETVNRVMGE